MKETKQHFHNHGNNFDTFLNSLGSVVEPAKPKHVGRPRGRPPKPVEERIEGNKYMVNGRLVRWGKKYNSIGRLRKKYVKRPDMRGKKHPTVKRWMNRRRWHNMSPRKKDRCRAYYRTMRMSYFRYRKKIKFRYKETFHDSFNLTVEEWCRIWNEAQDVFCTDTMQLHRPWDVKTKSPLTKKGAWFSKVDPDGPWTYNNCGIFYNGVLVPKQKVNVD